MPQGNHNMSDSACVERASHQQEHESTLLTVRILAKQVNTQQQQIKLLFKFVRQLQKELPNA